MAKDVYTGNYVFWIDQEIQTQSYCVPQNQVDKQSYLIKPYNLILIEVWRFDDQKVLTQQRGTVGISLQNISQNIERSTWTPGSKQNITRSMEGSPLKKKKGLKVKFKLDDDRVQNPQGGSIETSRMQSPVSPQFGDSQKIIQKYEQVPSSRSSKSVEEIIKGYELKKQ